MLLAIDTSAGTSVAVVDAEAGILAENGTPDTMRHAEVIGGLLERTLSDAGVERSQLSGVVAGMGPGPFTGLRVGIAAARAFALGLGKPVVPVMSHDAVAWEWYRAGNVGPLLVVTDARRREVAWSRYSTLDAAGLPELLDGPALAKAIEVPEFDAERLDAATISAGALGMVAELRWLARRPFAADEPVYLRSPDVTLSTAKRVS